MMYVDEKKLLQKIVPSYIEAFDLNSFQAAIIRRGTEFLFFCKDLFFEPFYLKKWPSSIFLFLFTWAKPLSTVFLTCSCGCISCHIISHITTPLVLCVLDILNYLSCNSLKCFFDILACLCTCFEKFHSVLISYLLTLFWLYNFFIRHIALIS